MHTHDRKRRLPVVHRGKRVPNLYTRPKRPDDTAYGDTFEVVFRDDSGKQRQKTLAARSVQRAIEEAEEYRTQLRRGEVLPPSPLTVDKIMSEYFDVCDGLVKAGERSERTVNLYRQRYRTHLKAALGAKRVQDVSTNDIAAIYRRQRNAGLAPWTIWGTHTTLSAMFRFALSRGYVLANPLDRLSKIEKPTQRSKRQARRLTETEVRNLCASATETYRPIVTTLTWTGVRVSEALGLRWRDIDFDAREIHIRHQLGENGTLKGPKTKAALRSIPLLPALGQELREHRKAQLKRGIAGSDQLVFTTAAGHPLDRHNVRNRGIVRAAKKAGMNDVTTHDLRRTFISHLIVGLGLDPVRVARIAGHSNVAVTLNTYADEFDKAMHRDDLMQRIERAGFGAA